MKKIGVLVFVLVFGVLSSGIASAGLVEWVGDLFGEEERNWGSVTGYVAGVYDGFIIKRDFQGFDYNDTLLSDDCDDIIDDECNVYVGEYDLIIAGFLGIDISPKFGVGVAIEDHNVDFTSEDIVQNSRFAGFDRDEFQGHGVLIDYRDEINGIREIVFVWTSGNKLVAIVSYLPVEYDIGSLDELLGAYFEKYPSDLSFSTSGSLFRYASWECYNEVTGGLDGETSCRSLESWRQHAEDACDGPCGFGGCGVSSFSAYGECGDGVCSDSDGGLNYYQKGELFVDGKPHKESVDFCQNEFSLIEHDCGYENGIEGSSHNGFGGASYECPNGCFDGACILDDADSAYCGDRVCGETSSVVELGEDNTIAFEGRDGLYVIEIFSITSDFVTFSVNGGKFQGTVGTKGFPIDGLTIEIGNIMRPSNGDGSFEVELIIWDHEDENSCPVDCGSGNVGSCGDGACRDVEIVLEDGEIMSVEKGRGAYNIEIECINYEEIQFSISDNVNYVGGVTGGHTGIFKKNDVIKIGSSGLAFHVRDIIYSGNEGSCKVVLVNIETQNTCPQDCTLTEEDNGVVSFNIGRGWNLMMGFVDPEEQIVSGDISEENIKAIYALTSDNQDYAGFFPNYEGDKLDRIGDYELLSSGFWVYSDRAGELEYELRLQPLDLEDRRLFAGWNFVGMSYDMISERGSFGDMTGGCNILGSYYFDSSAQNWKKVYLEDGVYEYRVGDVWVVGVDDDCNLGRVEEDEGIEPLPDLPLWFVDGGSGGGSGSNEWIAPDKFLKIGEYDLIYSDGDGKCYTPVNGEKICSNSIVLMYSNDSNGENKIEVILVEDKEVFIDDIFSGGLRNINTDLAYVYGMMGSMLAWFSEGEYEFVAVDLGGLSTDNEVFGYFYGEHSPIASEIEANECFDTGSWDEDHSYNLPVYYYDTVGMNSCKTDFILNETLCADSGDGIVFEDYTCEFGCTDGACSREGECVLIDIDEKVCSFGGVEYTVKRIDGCDMDPVSFEVTYGEEVENFAIIQNEIRILKNNVFFELRVAPCAVSEVNIRFTN